MQRFLPALRWMPAYRREWLGGDISAGLTVGVMLVPQGMAYALIAGLPPIYGLYASLVPILVYAMFGTSSQLAVGPVAIDSLLTAAGVAPLAGGDPGRYIELCLLLAVIVGIIQFSLGLLRFGFLANFLSHAVLTGFTAAAALVIGANQLKYLSGIDIPATTTFFSVLRPAWERLGDIHGITLAIGLAAAVLVYGLKKLRPRWPAGLLAVGVSTAVVAAFGLSEAGVTVVGAIQGGLPHLTLPSPTADLLRALLPTALTIALIGFTEAIAIAKVCAHRRRQSLDAHQELIALGAANAIGGLFMAYPVTGGLSRTAVNAQSGAHTPAASLVSAGVVALTLVFLTPLFHDMPRAVLAAIVLVAVAGLFDLDEMRFLWRAGRRDFALMAFTFLATLGLGIEVGILVGVGASLGLVLQQSSRPHVAVMGRIPNTDIYRNVLRHPDAIVQPGVLLFRMDDSLYFFNAGYLRDRIYEQLARDESIHTLILDVYPVNQTDASGLRMLADLLDTLQSRGIRLLMSGVKGPVMDKLQASGLAEQIGSAHFFMELPQATAFASAYKPARDRAPSSVPV
jgi:SulP family sulfate permease